MLISNILAFSAVVLNFSTATVDLNLPELQYLADHLHPEECRRLAASLHFKSYEMPRALDVAGENIIDKRTLTQLIAEINVSKDIPCIKLLLHWNSQPGEGKGETHEILQHRLRQIERSDLADWIGKTVFHQLGQDMLNGLKNPFDDILNVTEAPEYAVEPTLFPQSVWISTEWIAFDTICWAFVIFLSCLALFILFKATVLLIRRKVKRRIPPKKYATLENESSSESEDQFDIRTHTTASK